MDDVASFFRMRRWLLLGSVIALTAATSGSPQYQAGSFVTDHRLPIKQRWGGWYVTGKDESVVHLGNGTFTDVDHPETMESKVALTSLKSRFDTNLYLSLSPYNDIAALMVFDHQMRMMNLLTRVN